MNTPLITVAVTAYNIEQYVGDCLNSIEKQSYNNIEIILVNDGSIDKTGEIFDNHAKQDKRIKVIHKKNTGIGDSRNIAVEMSKGDYIVFIDGDDWVEPDFCKMLLELSLKYDADISSVSFRSHKMTFLNYNPRERKGADSDRVSVYSNIEALESVSINSCGKLYKKELFAKALFAVDCIHEDEFSTYKFVYYSNKVVLTGRQLYNRRLRPGSITRSEPRIDNLDLIDALKERSKFYEDKGLDILKIKVDKALVGTIARLKVKFRSNKIVNVKEIRKRLNSEMKDAVNNVLHNKKASYNQKIQVLLYYFIPAITVYAVTSVNRVIVRKKRI